MARTDDSTPPEYLSHALLSALRTRVNFHTADYQPYKMNGVTQAGLTWHNISYDLETSQGFFLIEFAAGAKSAPHQHIGYEEFVILKGELTDSDGATYRTGDCVSLKPGSHHSSMSLNGCIAAVFARGALRLT
jgi:anti-sigma factor ChrR (cupin superfamily)